MSSTIRIRSTAAALVLALGVSGALAPSAGADTADHFGTVAATQSGSTSGEGGSGSLATPQGQALLALGAGLAVSAALAIGAGIRGGAFPLPGLPTAPAV